MFNKSTSARIERQWWDEEDKVRNLSTPSLGAHGTFTRPGAWSVTSFLPSLDQEEVARATFLKEWRGNEGASFGEYGKYASERRKAMLTSLFTLGEREGLFRPTDREGFMAAQAAPHERMVKEKDWIRLFAHTLVDDCVKHFCYQSKVQFLEGTAAAKEAEGRDPSRRRKRLEELAEKEKSLGLRPVDPSETNAEDGGFDEFFKLRWESAVGLEHAVTRLENSGPMTPSMRRFAASLLYTTGPLIKQISGHEEMHDEFLNIVDDETGDGY